MAADSRNAYLLPGAQSPRTQDVCSVRHNFLDRIRLLSDPEDQLLKHRNCVFLTAASELKEESQSDMIMGGLPHHHRWSFKELKSDACA